MHCGEGRVDFLFAQSNDRVCATICVIYCGQDQECCVLEL